MSIKQNGGVFGRNPTFNDVTIDGTLTFDGDIDINSDLKVNGEIEAQKLIIAKNDRPNGAVIDITNTFEGSGWDGGDLIGSVDFKIADTSTPQKIRAAIRAEVDSSVSSSTYPYRVGVGVYTSNLAVLTKTAEFDYLGNLRMNSGNGIDFSATAGTGTSELLDDYEEGTWTPASVTGTVGVSGSATYTKVGNLVTLRATLVSFSDRSAASNIFITGIPFSSGILQAGGTIFGRDIAKNATAALDAYSKIIFYTVSSSSSYVALQHADLSSSSGAAIYLEATYLTS
jgi:hypothetical protein